MGHSFTNLVYHIVFATKDRRPLISDRIRPRLYNYIGGTIRGQGGIALATNGTADHVHILAKLRQDRPISAVMRDLKACVSGWLKQEFPEMGGFAWQTGYGAFSVSKSQIGPVRQYILNQELHHRQMSFEEEFISILKSHEIDFIEKYLWK